VPDALLASPSAKLEGTRALERALTRHQNTRVVLWSSLASLLGGPNTTVYTASNAFMDAFAVAQRGAWCSVGWDVWSTGSIRHGLDTDSAMRRLERILAARDLHHVYVSVRDLERRRIDVAERLRAEVASAPSSNAAGAEDHERVPRPQLAVSYVEPAGEIETALAEIWADVLGLEKVGREDPFFELGGDSLLATMLLSKVTARFGLDIPVDRFFEASTVARAAQVIVEALESDAPEDDMDALLAEIEGLSEEEAAALLTEEKAG
ncbi:MAG: phosphopantetheine-binding protein, partial [Myxococcota bacterium]